MVRSCLWGGGGRTGRLESYDLPFLLSLSLGPSSCNSWLLVDDSSSPYAQVLSRIAYLSRNKFSHSVFVLVEKVFRILREAKGTSGHLRF